MFYFAEYWIDMNTIWLYMIIYDWIWLMTMKTWNRSVSRRITTLPALKRTWKNPVIFRIRAAAAAENAVNRGATRGSAAELYRSPEVHIASEKRARWMPVRQCIGFLRDWSIGQLVKSIFVNPSRCSGILDGLELEILSFCGKDTVLAFTARSPLHTHKVGHVTWQKLRTVLKS